ncbi:Nif3-like dinuclear metal center hexameric protein [Sedimentibacter sp. LTW-03]|uniref:Nif3-like dinuclear metal center hexameric protein n=1 Tax=Sedimentibacter sp. LTW-03 TaxID=3453406 RepID=UPI003F854C6C
MKLLEDELKIKAQEPWDNSGLQIGSMEKDINNIMLTLDADLEAVNYAADNNIELIITHHPFFFSPIKSIDLASYEGKIIQKLIKNNINLYSLHTSFDMADVGVNKKLSELLSIKDYDVLHVSGSDLSGYGGVGNIAPVNIIEYADQVKNKLGADHVKLYCNSSERVIERVAFCGGSGSDFIDNAIEKEADVYITGDIKYHQAQSALRNNLCIIDAGHYYTEYLSMENIKKALLKEEQLKVKMLTKNTVKEQII